MTMRASASSATSFFSLKTFLIYIILRPHVFSHPLLCGPGWLNAIITAAEADRTGKPPNINTLKTKRSGVCNVFKWYKQGEVYDSNINSTLGKDGDNVFKGLTRRCKTVAQASDAPIREGKDPLPYQAYRKMAKGVF